MEGKNLDETGLSTEEALHRLQNDIEQVLSQFKLSQKSRNSRSWLRCALNRSSQHRTINLISIILLILSSSLLLFSYLFNPVTDVLICQSLLLLILTIISITIEVYDNKLRQNEILNRVQNLLLQMKTKCKDVKWTSSHYPHLLSPYSPCITLQWTYRDGKLVNLPWALLVKGDLILIRPGQIVPGYCEAIDKNSDFPLLHLKEVYAPSLTTANELFSVAKLRKPLEYKKYRLLETPYLHNLRIALEQSLDRPVTQHSQQRHLLMIKINEQFVVPSILVLIYVINFVRYMYLEHYIGSVHWVDSFVLVPVCTILPLLPIIFPIAWNLLNCYGMARFQIIFNESRKIQTEENFFEEEEDNKLQYQIVNINWIEILKNFVKVFKGDGDFLMRTANIVHVLGSITAFCCVDKKGVLSWPNPTAEKIFFLCNTDKASRTSSLANVGDLSADNDSTHDDENQRQGAPAGDFHGRESSHVEVLDLTHDLKDPFKLHFDDMNWHKNISSLKPLGLAILLNTCNFETQEYYTQFCSHITCEAMYNENLVPVANRRCLCELAKEIGFSSDAQKAFSLEQELSTYRHLQTEMVRRDNKYARSLQMQTKLKFPFPHMFAVIVKELNSGSTQLLTQGTADIILDSCVDYWDGQDLCPLTQADRKRIQDFYQRTSLTTYCTAFAYRPVNKAVNEKMGKMYLELPSDSRHLYFSHRSPSPIHWEYKTVLEPRTKTPLGPFCSTDSLLYNGGPVSDITDADSFFETQCNQVFIGMVTMQYQVISDMVHLIDQLESACVRFVHFSKENELRSRVFGEKMGLESGWNCHISLLSERGRGDSGIFECWANNGTLRVCSPDSLPKRRQQLHSNRLVNSSTSDSAKPLVENTSNLDSSKMLSYSAPSAINLNHSVVKFEDELKVANEKDTEDAEQPLQEIKDATSQESVQLRTVDLNTSHEWQSLSCLTDSSDQSAPINFDMSNRAKLPRGIDKIRPHIENIDNVPLLVSLFTDCTAATTKEMLHIMQDYGEVICVLGSSANFENAGIFIKADASIAVEPLYPQVCQKVSNYKQTHDGVSPVELSRMLNSISCSLSIKREDPMSVPYLIMDARHFMYCFWNCVQLWICCCATISCLQLVAALFMLPSILTPGQVLWLCCVIVPALSISLVGNPTDPDVMKKPPKKRHTVLNSEVVKFVLWCYGTKFLPVIFFVLLTFTGTLASYCVDICYSRNCECLLFYLPIEMQNATVVGGWSEHSNIVFSAQNFAVIIILLNFVAVSAGFVHREYSIWIRSPHKNCLWLVIVILILILQTLYTILSFKESARQFESDLGFKISNFTISFAFLSPFLTFLINEVIKRHEIKVNVRYQKRARLDFGTKLGMNSPF